MKNVCIVGCGNICPIHIRALEACPDAQLYALCDIDESKLNNYKEKCNVFYTDFDEMIKDKNIDSVHICTPHYLHTSMAVKALKHGKDVVVEKPIGISNEEIGELYQLSLKSNNKLCIMFQNRENVCIKMLKQITDEIDTKPVGICAFMTWQRTKEYYESAEWRGTWQKEGGALMINQAIHIVDLMVYLGGEVESIKSHISNKSLEGIIEAEDTAEMLLQYKDGLRGCLYATNAFNTYADFRLEVIYPDVTYKYENKCLLKFEKNKVPEFICADDMSTPGKYCWGNSHVVEINKFYSGSDDYIKISDVYAANSIVLAMYESSKNNEKSVKIINK